MAKITNVTTFHIKGTCVDDLFHILASNGYLVQMSTTNEPDKYEVNVVTKTEVYESNE